MKNINTAIRLIAVHLGLATSVALGADPLAGRERHPMARSRLFRWSAALTLAIALAPPVASAQETNTVSITGTCNLSWFNDSPGADLLGVLFKGNDHWWKLTLSGVSYSHDYTFWESDTWKGSGEVYRTRVHASSFTFEFFGPDAAILNDVVSSQLTQAGLELSNEVWVDSDGWPHSQGFSALRLDPPYLAPGVSFEVSGYSPEFPADENGYPLIPLIQPQRLWDARTVLSDNRESPEFGGELGSINDIVDIGSSEPPTILPLTLSIQDGSVWEGNRGTSNVAVVVTLSRGSSQAITVSYRTADGTAKAKEDYTATSGTLTFQPGETSRTISVSIMGDRKREANETFSVQLSNAVGATLADGIATVTILNDD
jgi:hypothetical protein